VLVVEVANLGDRAAAARRSRGRRSPRTAAAAAARAGADRPCVAAALERAGSTKPISRDRKLGGGVLIASGARSRTIRNGVDRALLGAGCR
jgi:hypothetical protein